MKIVRPFKKHLELKDTLLNLIDKMPSIKEDNKEFDKITKTDWRIPKDWNREYLNYFYKQIEDHMLMLCDEFKCSNWIIQNGWFQQYYKGDKHNWHNHSMCQFSNVYYLELPEPDMKTEFLDTQDVSVKEGDILTFSSYLLHRSKQNTSDLRKTIIAFNSSFEDWNGK
tara:strand:+ start:6391 stop:6894 length:504 start_codon:yes stop_codon:yes gene_type:complete